MKIAIAIHGGAGPSSEFIKNHEKEYTSALEEVISQAYFLLENGVTALHAVEEAIKQLENNELFNSGKGSVFNEEGKVMMSSSIMDGKDKEFGAVSLIQSVKNPISLARTILEKSDDYFLTGESAEKFAKEHGLEIKHFNYFFTKYQYLKYLQTSLKRENVKVSMFDHGTVGAVALDKYGNLAAGTSTGGSSNAKNGRISDSAIIGAATFADNKTCAVSCSGDAEVILKNHVSAFLSDYIQLKNESLTSGIEVLMTQLNGTKKDYGFIAVDKFGQVEILFNTDRMARAVMTSNNPKPYKALWANPIL